MKWVLSYFLAISAFIVAILFIFGFSLLLNTNSGLAWLLLGFILLAIISISTLASDIHDHLD